ncbi:MAG: dienelactone hydrolase family protein [Marmoricola sp.]
MEPNLHRCIRSARDQMSCYVVRPDAPSGAVVVLPELFGLTPHVLAMCDAVAAEGYEVVCPDLYHHVPGATVLPETDAGRDAGFTALAQRTADDLVGDVDSAAAVLGTSAAQCGLLGLSVGGYVGFLAAARLGVPRAALVYPGWLTSSTPPIKDDLVAINEIVDVRGRLLVSVGSEDALIPPAEQLLVRDYLRPGGHRLDVRPGLAHGFLSPSRLSYDAEGAASVWGQILAHLGEPGASAA